jgi:hypothetical protein
LLSLSTKVWQDVKKNRMTIPETRGRRGTPGIGKSRASLRVTSVPGPRIRQASGRRLRDRRLGTDGLFTCPSLRQPGDPSPFPDFFLLLHSILSARERGSGEEGREQRQGVGPWLCAPVLRRVCPFEEERRWDPSKDAKACPRWRPPELATPFARHC